MIGHINVYNHRKINLAADFIYYYHYSTILLSSIHNNEDYIHIDLFILRYYFVCNRYKYFCNKKLSKLKKIISY